MHLNLRRAVIGVAGALFVSALSTIPASAESVAPARVVPADTFTLLGSASSGVCSGSGVCQFIQIRLWQDNQTGGRHAEAFDAAAGTFWLQSGNGTRFGVTNKASGTQHVNTPVGTGNWEACGFAKVGSTVGPTRCTGFPV